MRLSYVKVAHLNALQQNAYWIDSLQNGKVWREVGTSTAGEPSRLDHFLALRSGPRCGAMKSLF